MIAYYVHWYYPPSSDDAVYYSGEEDKKLFHKLENAENYAKNRLNKWYKEQKRFYELSDKDENEGLTPEERDEWDALAYTFCGDLPNDYKICKREIKFEDE
jgi:hypothetical protein